MRILQLIPSLGSGGAERFVVDLCNEMSNQGADVYLCIIQNPDEKDYGFYLNELNSNVHFISLKQPKGFSFNNIGKLHSVIKSIKPDVIHAHLGILNYIYFIRLFTKDINYFYTIHTLAHRACTNMILKAVNYFFFRTELIRVIAISKECNDSYRNFYGLTNAFTIFNGRKKAEFSERYESTKEYVNSMKSDPEDLVFVHIARYHPLKNQKMLIESFSQLKSKHTNCILLIIGDWQFCDEAVSLTKQAGNGIYIIGTVTNVTDYLYLADAFCLTSKYEGLPISLLEAISCGCVPICTPVGGIVEVVKHNETGYLSDNITSEAYFEVLDYFVQHVNYINRDLLIEKFDKHYSIEKCSNSHISLYKSVIKQLC